MSSTFRFKQFSLDQQGSALKINTDGVLIGAKVAPAFPPETILDIGTGTGVIALMLAQRYPGATVDGVEIDPEAAECSRKNFDNSPFSHRLSTISGSFDVITRAAYYDLIVSNPPFYTRSLHNPDERKRQAKHTDISFFERLLEFAVRSITACGELHMILPTALAVEVSTMANRMGLCTKQKISIRSYPHTEVIREIISFSKTNPEELTQQAFVIYDEPGKYSNEYRQLLKPFFLAF